MGVHAGENHKRTRLAWREQRCNRWGRCACNPGPAGGCSATLRRAMAATAGLKSATHEQTAAWQMRAVATAANRTVLDVDSGLRNSAHAALRVLDEETAEESDPQLLQKRHGGVAQLPHRILQVAVPARQCQRDCRAAAQLGAVRVAGGRNR